MDIRAEIRDVMGLGRLSTMQATTAEAALQDQLLLVQRDLERVQRGGTAAEP